MFDRHLMVAYNVQALKQLGNLPMSSADLLLNKVTKVDVTNKCQIVFPQAGTKDWICTGDDWLICHAPIVESRC